MEYTIYLLAEEAIEQGVIDREEAENTAYLISYIYENAGVHKFCAMLNEVYDGEPEPEFMEEICMGLSIEEYTEFTTLMTDYNYWLAEEAFKAGNEFFTNGLEDCAELFEEEELEM